MAEQLELESQNTIRIETALSRFPVHKLSRRRGGITIDIKETTPAGEIKTKWEVTYNSKYGQPGPLAYKLDTLIINRRIDEARPSIPKVIKLGSLHEICRELGVSEGKSKNDVKRALRQNAFAGITAKISYRATNGTEQTLEADFTRYSIIFTGEKFPDGRRANAVYVILNDVYSKILNEAQTRPLDYDYLRELSPAAQRFYELIGFQIYAVLKHERPRARLSYADFCTRAPQTRYLDWEHVRKQMYKIHVAHLRSGYLAGVEFQEQQTESGEPDWLMFYTPGRRALAEFKEANRKHRAPQRPNTISRALPCSAAEPNQLARQVDSPPCPAQIGESDDASEQLVSKLMTFHVAEATAKELVRDYRKSVELQLKALPHRHTEKIKDLASWLVQAIRENYELPEGLKRTVEKEEEVKKQLARKEAEQAHQKRREALQPAYYDLLRKREGEHQRERQKAYGVFLAAEAQQRAEIENNQRYKPRFKKHLLEIFDHPESHLDRLRAHFIEPTLDEWLELQPKPS